MCNGVMTAGLRHSELKFVMPWFVNLASVDIEDLSEPFNGVLTLYTTITTGPTRVL